MAFVFWDYSRFGNNKIQWSCLIAKITNHTQAYTGIFCSVDRITGHGCLGRVNMPLRHAKKTRTAREPYHRPSWACALSTHHCPIVSLHHTTDVAGASWKHGSPRHYVDSCKEHGLQDRSLYESLLCFHVVPGLTSYLRQATALDIVP